MRWGMLSGILASAMVAVYSLARQPPACPVCAAPAGNAAVGDANGGLEGLGAPDAAARSSQQNSIGINGAPRAGDWAPACRNWTWPDSAAGNPPPGNRVCAVVRTFQAQLQFMPTFISSMAHGAVPFRLFFVVTDPNTDRAAFEAAVRNYADGVLGCPDLVRVLDIGEADVWDGMHRALDDVLKKVECRDGNCWDLGYGYTDAALDRLFGPGNDRNPYGCDWLLTTNGDNLYSTAFAEKLLPWMDGGEEGPADLIGFDFVSRYVVTAARGWKFEPGPDVVGEGPARPIWAQFKLYEIDLGAALVRVPYLLRQGLRRGAPVGSDNPPMRMMANHGRRYLADRGKEKAFWPVLADGQWMQELAERIGEEQEKAGKGGRRRKVIVRRTLMIHQ